MRSSSLERRSIDLSVLVAMASLAAVWLGHGSSAPVGAAAALLGAVVLVGALPGYLLVTLLSPNGRGYWPESWLLATGFSLFLVEVACVAGLSLHIPLHVMGLAIVAAGVVASSVLAAFRKPESRKFTRPPATTLQWLAIGAWLLCAALAYLLGHNDIDEQRENLIAIGLADSLQTALNSRDAWYLNGVPPVYPFPGIHYAYALFADIAGTTTIFVFDKVRFFWTLTALATVFVGVRAFSDSEERAYLALLGSSVLLLTGQFGAIPGFYWGQLAPTSHPADISMNVLAPAALGSMLLWLTPKHGARAELLFLFICAALVLSATHQRELVQVMIYAGCALLLARKHRARLLFATLPPIGAVLAFRLWSESHGPGITDLMSATRAGLWHDFRQLNLLSMFQPYAARVTNYAAELQWGLNGLMLPVTALLFLARRASLPVRVSGLALAFFILVASFAVLAIPLLWFTYDEFLFTPLRHVIFILYCGFWAAVGNLGAKMIFDETGLGHIAKPIGGAVLLGVALAGLSEFFSYGFIPAEMLLLLVAACGLVACLFGRRKDVTGPIGVKRMGNLPLLVLVLTFASLTAAPSNSVLTRLFNHPIALRPETALQNLYSNYLAAMGFGPDGGCRAGEAELLKQKFEFEACTPPLEVVQSLNQILPKEGVLLIDPLGGFFGTGLVPPRLAAPVRPDLYFRDWETALPRFRDLLQQSLADHEGMPFFGPGISPERRFLDARKLGATYVLIDPPRAGAGMQSASARPDLFSVVMNRDGWVVLAVSAAEEPR